MLQITIPSREVFDEYTSTFFMTKEYTLNLEHSLLSISKWESKYCKPFLAVNKQDKRTPLEMLYYIKCMTLNKNVPDEVYASLTEDNIKVINDYIMNPMTATTIKDNGPKNRQIITSELIYYWMIQNQIPFECEKWHINRLLTLIRVCNSMNAPKKNQKPDLIARNKLNMARRKAAKSRG